MIECKLISSETQTGFGPLLCVLGHYLTQKKVLKPLERVKVPQKTIKHSPAQKLTDGLIGVLAGCRALYEIDMSGCVRMRPSKGLSEGTLVPISPQSRTP